MAAPTPSDKRGYEKLATLIARDPRMSFFRRFSALNAKNLLYLQAEIVYLEEELKKLIERDNTCDVQDRNDFSISLWHLKHSERREGDETSAQWLKVLEIRELLDKYNSAILQQAQLLRFSYPDKRDLDRFQGWLADPDGGNWDPKFSPESNQWGGENAKDLLALFGRQEEEGNLTRWVYWRLMPWFHKKWGEKSEKWKDVELNVWLYSDKRIKSVTRMVSIVVAAILPASAMIVLYFLKVTVARLLIIFFYNLVFSVALGFMVKARPVEIFAAATAFAAVQVTMVTNAPGDCQCLG